MKTPMPQNKPYDKPVIADPKHGDFLFYGKYWWILDTTSKKWVCRNRYTGAREHSKDIHVKALDNLLTQSHFSYSSQTEHLDDTSYSKTHLTVYLDKSKLKKVGLIIGISAAIMLFLFCGL